MLLLVAPATAGATSIEDRDIGWDEGLRKRLGLERPRTSECEERDHDPGSEDFEAVIRGARDPSEAIRRIFKGRWGDAWVDHCDHGRFKIGITPKPRHGLAGRPKRARAVVRRMRLQRVVRFVAVRSTYEELDQGRDALVAQFERRDPDLFLLSGIDTSLNAVVIEYNPRSAPELREHLHLAALAAPVNFVLEPGDPDRRLVPL